MYHVCTFIIDEILSGGNISNYLFDENCCIYHIILCNVFKLIRSIFITNNPTIVQDVVCVYFRIVFLI